MGGGRREDRAARGCRTGGIGKKQEERVDCWERGGAGEGKGARRPGRGFKGFVGRL